MTKKCAICRDPIENPRTTLQRTCPKIECAIAWGKSKKGREHARTADKRHRRERKAELQPLSHWVKMTQQAFNAYIRERDRDQPCITCGTMNPTVKDEFGGVWDAGHYRTVGACPELRFDPRNCHKQCKSCNGCKDPGKAEWVREQYQVNILTRITPEEKVELDGPHDAKHYTREDLAEIRREVRALTRKLKEAA